MAKLVVCCDGTWNDDADRTHIFRISEAAQRLEEPTVRVFYDPGVGTQRLSRLRGGALGRGLSQNIRQTYAWLARAWRPDDQIFVFGFSRGAYTVRSLGGLISFAGLLNDDDIERAERAGEDLIKKAYQAYRMVKREPERAARFRDRPDYARTRRPQIRFMGVFDTVGALGVPVNWLQSIFNRLPFSEANVEFHDTTLGRQIEIACQALGIDERRGPFRPTFWTGTPQPEQTVKQVWFAGVHSDIGGGYPEKALAELPLGWMLNEARAAGLDLWPGFAADRLQADASGPIHDSMDSEYLAFHRLPSIDPYDRPIGPGQRPAEDPVVPGEMVHWSARDRVEGEAARRLVALRLAAYRPRALVDHGGAWRSDTRDWSWLDER